MAEELNELEKLTHHYRRSLAAFESRTGHDGRFIDTAGSGEERQRIARMDADLSAIEQRMQAMATEKAAAEKRAAELEARLAEPVYAPKATANTVESRDSMEYAQRWLKAVASGNPAEMRALTTGSANAGIPTDMERRIVERMFKANVMRQISTVSTIDSKRTIPVQNALPTTALVAEADPISASDPSWSSAISVVPHKLATRVTMSQEFIEDAIGDAGIGSGLQYVADKCALSIALKQEEYYTVGTGSGQPQGICVDIGTTGAISQGINLGVGGLLTATTADNVIDAVHAVPPQYRTSPRFRWLVSDTMLKQIRKLKDNAGYYVFSPAGSVPSTNVVGLPGTIYGVPYSVGQYVPTATSDNNVFAVVGDFSYFEIFDRTGITSMIDPYSGAANHNVNLYVYTRTDSHIMLPEAFAAIYS
jgi:HK97 family phage major capsid protein